MSKLIGLDVGDVRVGVAIADTETRIATPHQTFKRAEGRAEAEILKLIREYSVEIVVSGIPLDEQGGRTTQCDKVESFCRRLERRAPVRVHYVDEYLTTVEAEQQFIPTRHSAKEQRQKGVLDALSASIILQSYLDNRDK